MYIFQQFLLALGGITLFLLGLKLMSDNMELLAGKKMKVLLYNCTKNKYLGVLTGAFTTAIIQSSIATNVILVGFVSNGVMTFYNASSVIMGANIGTTMTAQLVSLSGKEVFSITAIGSFVAFVGFILSLLKNAKYQAIGGVMLGFGTLFLGLDIVSNTVSFFKSIEGFRNIFLAKNDLVSLLNGILITAIIQSSSAVTSVIIILASNGLVSFESSMFLVLGANIGTCLSVLLATIGKPVEARRTAFFNLAFNVFGTLIFLLPLSIFKSQISTAFSVFSGSIERQIANFHTLFNLSVTIILLPILKPFTNLISKLIIDKNGHKIKKSTKNAKIYVKA